MIADPSRNGGPPGDRVLVTGGAGFIGTNLVDRLAGSGHRVRVFDDLSRARVEENLRWLRSRHPDRVEVEVGSVTDRRRIRRALEGVDAVVHLAAQVAVTTSVREPVRDFDVNLRGTVNLLEGVRAVGGVPVLFTSTNKVYGDLAGVELEESGRRYRPARGDRRSGISEDQPLAFRSPYGCSKGAADQYVLDYGRIYGFPTSVFRMSCIYGPHQHGTEDQGWVAHFLLRVLAGRPITLFGDGKQVRDVLFVDDLVDAFVEALDRPERVAGTAFNVGGGPENAVSLLEVLDLIDELEGEGPDVRFDAWRPGDQRWYVSDTRRLRERTGWRPRVGYEDGIRRLWSWLRERKEAGALRAVAAAG